MLARASASKALSRVRWRVDRASNPLYKSLQNRGFTSASGGHGAKGLGALSRVGLTIVFVGVGICGINYKLVTDESFQKLFQEIVPEPHASEYIKELKVLNQDILARIASLKDVVGNGQIYLVNAYNSTFKSVHEFISLVNSTATSIYTTLSSSSDNAMASITQAYTSTIKTITDLQASLDKWFNEAKNTVTSTSNSISSIYHSSMSSIHSTIELIQKSYNDVMLWIHNLLNPGSPIPKQQTKSIVKEPKKNPVVEAPIEQVLEKKAEVEVVETVVDPVPTPSPKVEETKEEPKLDEPVEVLEEVPVPVVEEEKSLVIVNEAKDDVIHEEVKKADHIVEAVPTAIVHSIAEAVEEVAKPVVDTVKVVEEQIILVEEPLIAPTPPIPQTTLDMVEVEDLPTLDSTIPDSLPRLQKSLTDLAHYLAQLSAATPDTTLKAALSSTGASVLAFVEGIEGMEADHVSHLMHTLQHELSILESKHAVELEKTLCDHASLITDMQTSFDATVKWMDEDWKAHVKESVDAERGGRLARLDDLTKTVHALEQVVVSVAEKATRTAISSRIQSIISPLMQGLEEGDVESVVRIWSKLGKLVDSSNDELVRTVYESVTLQDLARFKPSRQVVSEFGEVAEKAHRAVYVPHQAGVVSYCIATLLSYITIPWPGSTNAGKLYKARIYAREGYLEECVRESVSSCGIEASWARYILQDWAEDAWHTLRVLKAVKVIQAWSVVESVTE